MKPSNLETGSNKPNFEKRLDKIVAEASGEVVDLTAVGRARWLSVLAQAKPGDLDRLLDTLAPLPPFTPLRRPETGMVMVRGRAGGAGDEFNLGEMTVTRAAVRLVDGPAGVGYVAGRDHGHAERAAIVDALLQTPQWRDDVLNAVISPLQDLAAASREDARRQAAATKVDFFTMVRTREPK